MFTFDGSRVSDFQKMGAFRKSYSWPTLGYVAGVGPVAGVGACGMGWGHVAEGGGM